MMSITGQLQAEVKGQKMLKIQQIDFKNQTLEAI